VRDEPIAIVDWQPDWAGQFRRYAARISAAMGSLALAVEHVGSTAVPGLFAKPVIDIDVVVPDVSDVPEAIELIERIGYRHEGDLGVRGREAFMWPPGEERHHVYVVVAGGTAHHDHVWFRDHLRGHPDVAREYGQLKRSLAAECGDDREAYTEAKSKFIARVLAGRD
jgi:GrpB-like predicted nucleotidyltransferase (UPF0157 family)